MADYTFDTSGDMSDALRITPVKEQTQAMITPSAEEIPSCFTMTCCVGVICSESYVWL